MYARVREREREWASYIMMCFVKLGNWRKKVSMFYFKTFWADWVGLYFPGLSRQPNRERLFICRWGNDRIKNGCETEKDKNSPWNKLQKKDGGDRAQKHSRSHQRQIFHSLHFLFLPFAFLGTQTDPTNLQQGKWDCGRYWLGLGCGGVNPDISGVWIVEWFDIYKRKLNKNKINYEVKYKYLINFQNRTYIISGRA